MLLNVNMELQRPRLRLSRIIRELIINKLGGNVARTGYCRLFSFRSFCTFFVQTLRENLERIEKLRTLALELI